MPGPTSPNGINFYDEDYDGMFHRNLYRLHSLQFIMRWPRPQGFNQIPKISIEPSSFDALREYFAKLSTTCLKNTSSQSENLTKYRKIGSEVPKIPKSASRVLPALPVREKRLLRDPRRARGRVLTSSIAYGPKNSKVGASRCPGNFLTLFC